MSRRNPGRWLRSAQRQGQTQLHRSDRAETRRWNQPDPSQPRARRGTPAPRPPSLVMHTEACHEPAGRCGYPCHELCATHGCRLPCFRCQLETTLR